MSPKSPKNGKTECFLKRTLRKVINFLIKRRTSQEQKSELEEETIVISSEEEKIDEENVSGLSTNTKETSVVFQNQIPVHEYCKRTLQFKNLFNDQKMYLKGHLDVIFILKVLKGEFDYSY